MLRIDGLKYLQIDATKPIEDIFEDVKAIFAAFPAKVRFGYGSSICLRFTYMFFMDPRKTKSLPDILKT